MSGTTEAHARVEVIVHDLRALDGANPLGFLAALGVITVLRDAGLDDAKLGWQCAAKWTPYLLGVDVNEDELCNLLRKGLSGIEPPREACDACAKAKRLFDDAKAAVKKSAKEAIRQRGLTGAERRKALEKADEKRKDWLKSRRDAVRSPELELGSRIDCTEKEFREFAAKLVGTARCGDRAPLDLLAAFGSDACVDENRRIVATPFCLIKGSGHQFFLETANELMGKATDAGIRAALFEPWTYADEKLSMRWDPTEDRRYALMDSDPSASASRTVWMANLLGYRALELFPCAPSTRGLATTGWARIGEDQTFTWPIWEPPVDAETIRSLLQQAELTGELGADERNKLRARGVAAFYRVRRIQVGNAAQRKLNLSPARGV